MDVSLLNRHLDTTVPKSPKVAQNRNKLKGTLSEAGCIYLFISLYFPSLHVVVLHLSLPDFTVGEWLGEI